jgi:hypothetical protein
MPRVTILFLFPYILCIVDIMFFADILCIVYNYSFAYVLCIVDVMYFADILCIVYIQIRCRG